MDKLFIYLLGAAGYGILELLWRGYTHWTMLVVGGLCFFLIYYLFGKYSFCSIWEKALAGSMIITVVELVSGIIINVILGWAVWDYSKEPFNIMGQVCLLYSGLWFGVSAGLVYLCKSVEKLVKYLSEGKNRFAQ
ncbi:MAG: hypothetical protein IJD30_04765 [Clostridia bacterium]|nr:hypothetical protein [Clostridia bacterium]